MCSILMVSSLFLTIVVAEEKANTWTPLKVSTTEDLRTCQPIKGERTYRCPSTSSNNSYNDKLVCIKRSQFCDKHRDCPNGSDEDLTKCMFYELTESQIQSVREGMYTAMQELHEKRESETINRLRSFQSSNLSFRK